MPRTLGDTLDLPAFICFMFYFKKYYLKLIILLPMFLANCKRNKPNEALIKNPINESYSRVGIIKTKIGNKGYFVMYEKLSPLTQSPGNRYLVITNFMGNKITEIHEEINYQLIDFSLTTNYLFILYSGVNGFIINKFDQYGNLKETKQIWKSNPSTSYATNDRGRLSANDNMVSVAIRPEDYSTRLISLNTESLDTNWTTLIEPPQRISGLGMVGGSYDSFEQLAHPYMVFIDLDGYGNTYISVPGLYSSSIYWHNQHFAESHTHLGSNFISFGLETDALVTKVTPNGKRLYTVVAGSYQPDECYGIKVIQSSFYLFGRVGSPTNTTGYQWDAYVAKYNCNTGNREFFQSFDIDHSEIVYDIEETVSKDLIAVGSSGWSQNPLGFSVSEKAQKLIFLLDQQGNFKHEINIGSGPRHNQVRSISKNNNELLIGGWENGPGTHSGDSDHRKVYADGFLQFLKL